MSGPLLGLSVYNITKTIFDIPNPQHWFFNAGVQLVFKGGVLTFGWSHELEMFLVDDKSFEELFETDRFYEIGKEHVPNLQNLIGKTIKSVDFKWIPFQIIDPNTAELKPSETILEMNLVFSSEESLQIAPTSFELSHEDDPINYRPQLAAELLIALNHKFDLKLD